MAELSKVAAKTAGEVCGLYKPGEKTVSLLGDGGMAPHAFLDALLAAGEEAEARRFLAHALAKREAVWWALQAVEPVLNPAPPAPHAEALATAKRWVTEPTESHRRQAWSAAEAAGFDNPAGMIALAVFFSGGSLSPPDLPPVPPAGHLTGDTVANALTLAGVLTEPVKAPEKHAAFLAVGLDVASGKLPCPEPQPASAGRPKGS
jgi:hypothetical protein